MVVILNKCVLLIVSTSGLYFKQFVPQDRQKKTWSGLGHKVGLVWNKKK